MPPWIPGTGIYTTTTAAPFTVTYDTTATTAPVTYYTMTYDANQTDETCMEEEYDFGIGDIVRIKDRDDIPDDVYFGWDENMAQWCGQEFVIAGVEGLLEEPRLIFEDASEEMKCYSWGADMVEYVGSIGSQKELSNEEMNNWNTLMNQV